MIAVSLSKFPYKFNGFSTWFRLKTNFFGKIYFRRVLGTGVGLYRHLVCLADAIIAYWMLMQWLSVGNAKLFPKMTCSFKEKSAKSIILMMVRENYLLPVFWIISKWCSFNRHMVAICLAAFFFMLPWQFAQFALLTQTACVFALYMLEYIGSWKVELLSYGVVC